MNLYQSEHCKETWKYLSQEATLDEILDLKEMCDMMADLKCASERDQKSNEAASKRLR